MHFLDEEVGPTKVFVVESRAAMVLNRDAVGVAPTAVAVTWSCPAPLQAIERNSAECYSEALRRACTQDYDTFVDEKFVRQVDVACHDEHKSNAKAERIWSKWHPNRAKLELLCDAHKKATVVSRVFEL